MRQVNINITPRLVRALVLVSLQNYFAGHPEYPYVKDQASTSIFIQEDLAEDARYDDIVPGIIVEPSNVNFEDTSVGANADKLDMHLIYIEGVERQFDVKGALTITCISHSSIEAEELAFEIGLFLQSVRWHLMKMFSMQNISIQGYSKPFIMNREGTIFTYGCQIVLSYSMAKRMKIVPIDPGPLLKDIDTIITGTGGEPPETIDLGDGLWANHLHAGVRIIPDPSIDPGTPVVPGGPDYVDDGWVDLRLTVTNEEISVG